jgi:hypothetical protein
MKTAEVEQGFDSRRVQGALLTFVRAGLIVERGKLSPAEAVEPLDEGFRRVKAAIPGLMSRLVQSVRQSEAALDSLQDHLDGCKASQSSAFSGIVVGRTGDFVHTLRFWASRPFLEE